MIMVNSDVCHMSVYTVLPDPDRRHCTSFNNLDSVKSSHSARLHINPDITITKAFHDSF